MFRSTIALTTIGVMLAAGIADSSADSPAATGTGASPFTHTLGTRQAHSPLERQVLRGGSVLHIQVTGGNGRGAANAMVSIIPRGHAGHAIVRRVNELGRLTMRVAPGIYTVKSLGQGGSSSMVSLSPGGQGRVMLTLSRGFGARGGWHYYNGLGARRFFRFTHPRIVRGARPAVTVKPRQPAHQ